MLALPDGTGIAWHDGTYIAEGVFRATEPGCDTLMEQEMRLVAILTGNPCLTLQDDRMVVEDTDGGRLDCPNAGGPHPWP